MLLRRVLTALLGISLIWGAYYFFPAHGLTVLCCLVTFITCIEFSYFIEKESWLNRTVFTFVSYFYFALFTFVSQSFITFILCFIVLAFFMLICSSKKIHMRIEPFSLWLIGLVYCGGLTGITVYSLIEFGPKFFVALLLISFSNDTFAFIGGKLLGKTKLRPRISPNKTREGSASGLIGGTLAGVLLFYYIFPQWPWYATSLCCFLVSISSQVGDLFESLVKRYSGVKDSGKIMPGHGGVLDRIDGVLFAAPVLYFGFISMHAL